MNDGNTAGPKSLRLRMPRSSIITVSHYLDISRADAADPLED